MQDRTFNCWSRHHSSYTSQHTPLIIHHSSYTTQHTPLIIHHLSYTPHHTRLIIHSLRVQDRFYIQIRIPFSPMCDMQGLPPLKNATVGCVSMWTASLASRGGRMCVISRRGHTGIPWVKSPERVRLTGGRACWRERGHSYRSISSYRKLPPPACPGTTCIWVTNITLAQVCGEKSVCLLPAFLLFFDSGR